jgi:hypothetical protein
LWLFAAGGAGLSSDLWYYSVKSNVWRMMIGSGSVTDRHIPQMWLDTANKKLYIYGGRICCTTAASDMYSVDISAVSDSVAAALSYTPLTPSVNPGIRWGGFPWFDDLESKLYLFAGSSEALGFNDVWAYDIAANNWTQITANQASPPTPTDGVFNSSYAPGQRAQMLQMPPAPGSRTVSFGAGGTFDDAWFVSGFLSWVHYYDPLT